MAWIFGFAVSSWFQMGIPRYLAGSERWLTWSTTRARVWQACSLGSILVWSLSFVSGIPSPGDMNNLDDSTLTRLIIWGLLALAAINTVDGVGWIPAMLRGTYQHDEGLRGVSSESVLSQIVAQFLLTVVGVVAMVRGFSDSPFGAEYHWWLLPIFAAQSAYVLFARRGLAGAPRLVRRLVLVLGVLMAVLILAVFWLQPLRLAPGVVSSGLLASISLG